ncbi:MAG: DHH family phosphoesterase [Acidobacteriota bacterium]
MERIISELTRQRFAALRDYLEPLPRSGPRSGRWLVLTHDNPDPDSLTAAGLLGQLLRQAFRQKVTVAYSGIIGRAENRQLAKTAGFKLSHVRHLRLGSYSHFALVDTQPRTGNNALPEDAQATLVIDHHPPRKTTLSAPVVDIRTDYGATATIVAEYLAAAGLQITRAGATAVVYAIRSETQDFARESAGPDKLVYDTLLPHANKRLLGKIQAAPLPLSYYRNLGEAIHNLEAVDTLVLSHLGEVEQPDIVPEIADLLLRLEGKTWSLCTGTYQDRIYLSIRTTNPRAQAGQIMRRLVGRKGKGGGHSMTAGGWVHHPGNGKATSAQRRLGTRLAKYLRKKPEKIVKLLAKLPAE